MLSSTNKKYMPMKNALRIGLENMGLQLPRFNFSLPVILLGNREKNKQKNQTIWHCKGTQKTINRKHGKDRRD